MLCKFAPLLLTLLACCYATPPPGYIKPPEVDKFPPKYEYGYTIQDNKGSGQGKLESREGIFSLGRYFVQLGGPKGASQNVEYITDEWGYHPLVEYSSMGDHSQTSTQFALGEKAVEALRKNVRAQISVKDQLNQIVQSGIQAASPTQSTNYPSEKQNRSPSPSPSPVTFIQTAPVPSPQSKLQTNHQPIQENIPVLQNAIPLQYIFQPFNVPQAQYLIQPQVENLPQPQFLIQDQNIQNIQHIPQTQFIIPLYDPGLDNSPQIHQVNFNLPLNQQNVNKNINLDAQIRKEQNRNAEAQIRNEQNKNIQEEQAQQENNLELQKNVAVSNQNEDKKVGLFVPNTNEKEQLIPKQEVETIQINNGINNQQNIKYQTQNLQNYNNAQYQTENINIHNNGQYLVETKQHQQPQQQPQQNVVVLPQIIQENKVVVQNSGQIIESSTAKYNEKIKQDQQEIEYISQAIQNDLNLQNTEPLFGNTVSEVKYTNRNSAASNRIREQNTFDESILDLENPGGYGSRIISKKPNSVNFSQNNYFNTRLIDSVQNNNDFKTKQIDSVQNNNDFNTRLIDSVQNNNDFNIKQKDSVQNNNDFNTKQIDFVQNNNDFNTKQIDSGQNNNDFNTRLIDTVQNNNDFNTKQIDSVQNINDFNTRQIDIVQYNNNFNTKQIDSVQNNNDFNAKQLDSIQNNNDFNTKQINSVQNNNDFNTKLIDRTRNLVTGVDVLNINDAITNYVATAYAENQTEQQNKNIINEYTSGNVQYGYNENVPNTILEVVSTYNNKNILNNAQEVQEQKVITESTDYNNDNIVQQSNIETGGNIQVEYKTENLSAASVVQHNNLITSSSTYSSEANAIQNTRNKILQILNSEKVQKKQNNHISFADQPIIVADFENYQENSVQSTTENYKQEKTISETVYSTTQNTIETKITENNIVSTESPILITPRPVSNSFLAPITAAVSLQNSAVDIEDLKNDNYAPETSVEVQKSVPYYLGKLEYIESQENINSQQSAEEESLSTKLIVQKGSSESESSEEQIISQEQNESNNYPRAEALIQNKGKNNLNIPDQLTEQGQVKQQITSAMELKQIINMETPTAEAQESKVVNKPAEVTKYIEKPYPVEIPIGIPYAIEKQVPVEVERIVEKPVQITRIVEKPVPVHIPQPYPVEVERIIEKQVKVPVEITKYINNPYPVHIPYPEPVAVPVEFERLVQTVVKEPYPVEVPVRVEVPVKVHVPHHIHITKYIDKPYPVEKIVEKPVTVEKIIEKPVTKYIDKPYPVHVHVPVPHPVAVPVEIKVPQPYPVEVTKYIEKPYGLAQAYSAPVPKTIKPLNQNQHQQQQVQYPVTKLVQIPVDVPKYYDRQVPLYFHQQQKQNPYLYAPKYQIEWKNVVNCDLNHKHNLNHGQHRFAKIQDYIGLVPPIPPQNIDHGNLNSNYKRKARNSFEQNLRIEYGFKPPIIPSVQTDEFGMPLNKED